MGSVGFVGIDGKVCKGENGACDGTNPEGIVDGDEPLPGEDTDTNSSSAVRVGTFAALSLGAIFFATL